MLSRVYFAVGLDGVLRFYAVKPSGCAVGRGAVPQDGKLRVRFPVGSLQIFK